jgi:Tfp pilus assembly PilM family ATPase
VQVSERDAAALVSELAQQLSLLCSSEDEEIKLDGIRLNGGGSVVPGVVEILADTVQIPVRQMTPHAHISIPAEFNTELVESSAPFMAIAVGLALRCPGDHIVPEYLE